VVIHFDVIITSREIIFILHTLKSSVRDLNMYSVGLIIIARYTATLVNRMENMAVASIISF
jgi:hypothetical protein